MLHQQTTSFPTTPTTAAMSKGNLTSLVCPPPPQSCKPSIRLDGASLILPSQLKLSSDIDPKSVIDGPDSEREVIFSLKPRSSLKRVMTDDCTTRVPLSAFPPVPFGRSQSSRTEPQVMVKSLTNTSKVPSQVCQPVYTQLKKRHAFSARSA